MEGKHVVHWFRRGLRLHDNPALLDSLEGATTFRCIYILDPHFAHCSHAGVNRWRFLLQCLEDLNTNLRKLNTRLYVIRGQPAAILPQLVERWHFDVLSFEEEPEPWGRERDSQITLLLQSYGVSVLCRPSHTLYNLAKIIEKRCGQPPLTYAEFLQLIKENIGMPDHPSPTITIDIIPALVPVWNSTDENQYTVPTIDDLGFEIDEIELAYCSLGGETEALCRLEKYLTRKKCIGFDCPKLTWECLLAQSTCLAPYLRFGCLSPKLVFARLSQIYKQTAHKEPPLSLFGHLFWREFFYLIAYNNLVMDKMQSNPICVQIPWDRNPQALAKWANGHTGYPFIDAVMNQLRQEGIIHNICKHLIICFLTRGDLFISWQEGVKVFEELSLDGDWSINNGTWLWLSGSSFFQNFLRTYSPVKFGRKLDPEGLFIKKYVPALKRFPQEFIHEPWLATADVQRKAKCILGKDYPFPMIDHDIVVKINAKRIVQAYQFLVSFRGFVGTMELSETKKNSSLVQSPDSSSTENIQ